MTFTDTIGKLVGLPENHRLRYDAVLPSTAEIGRLLSGFSNSDGGVLIMGVSNKNGRIRVTGLSPDFNVTTVLENALAKLTPSVIVESGFIERDGMRLFAVKVDRSDNQVSFQSVAYTMNNKVVQPKDNFNSNNINPNKGSMNVNEKLDKILKYLTANPSKINLNSHIVQQTILSNTVSRNEAEALISKLRKSGYVASYGSKYIGWSLETEIFLNEGGYSKTTIGPVKTIADRSIFISYNWADKATAQRLYDFFTKEGYNVQMDDHRLTYKDKISVFMESIRTSNFAILIIGDEYLKSENCMTEILHLVKDRNFVEKILPIRKENVKIFKPLDRIRYTDYWRQIVDELEKVVKDRDPAHILEEIKKLKTLRNIQAEVSDFLSTIGDMITSTIEQEEKESYQGILDYIRRR